jgi:hypothetical protein
VLLGQYILVEDRAASGDIAYGRQVTPFHRTHEIEQQPFVLGQPARAVEPAIPAQLRGLDPAPLVERDDGQ